MILDRKLTLNHQSLMDVGEETRMSLTARKKEEGEKRGN